METTPEEDAVWSALNLSETTMRHMQIPPSKFDDVSAALCAPDMSGGFESALAQAVASSVEAYTTVLPIALEARDTRKRYLGQLDAVVEKLLALDARLASCEDDIVALQAQTDLRQSDQVRSRLVEAHVSAFLDEAVLDPALVRHIVDGRVGDDKYVKCLATLRKKIAVFELRDTRRSAAYKELRPVLDRLVATASAKVCSFLVNKMDLLRRPNTNIQIIKENVLLKHSELVLFLEDISPSDFQQIKELYVSTIAPLYETLFRKYSSGLMALKVNADSDHTEVLVGYEAKSSTAPIGGVKLSNLMNLTANGSKVGGPRPNVQAKPPLSSATAVEATTAAAAATELGLFTLGNRIDVLAKVDAPAIILIVAENHNLRFFYEEVHRSLGRMLSETCASEHMFCQKFFGETGGAMFDIIFKGVVDLLLDAVTTHTATSSDLVGVLLALKVNEAQRTSMQLRNIFDLSDYFIRVDIALKPKFKRLFDANVSSLVSARRDLESLFPGDGNTKPISLTRRFAELSSSVLAISAYGTTDDAILEGLRRLRSEFNALIMAISARFKEDKSRYVFLVNNIDLILSVYASRRVDNTPDARFFEEVQVGYTAAYVEQEVSDHFLEVVMFVRGYEHRLKNMATRGSSLATKESGSPTEEHLRAILQEFASNWHLGVEHMRQNVLRIFPNFRTGNDILRALYARLFAYHRRCETAVSSEYPSLKHELISGTELAYEVRQLSKPFMQ